MSPSYQQTTVAPAGCGACCFEMCCVTANVLSLGRKSKSAESEVMVGMKQQGRVSSSNLSKRKSMRLESKKRESTPDLGVPNAISFSRREPRRSARTDASYGSVKSCDSQTEASSASTESKLAIAWWCTRKPLGCSSQLRRRRFVFCTLLGMPHTSKKVVAAIVARLRNGGGSPRRSATLTTLFFCWSRCLTPMLRSVRSRVIKSVHGLRSLRMSAADASASF